MSEIDTLRAQKERKRALIIEMCVVLSLTWLTSTLVGLGDFLFPARAGPLPTWMHVERMCSLAAMTALPIYLFWNNGESLRKLGFRKFGWGSLVLAALVFVLDFLCVRLVPASVADFARPWNHPGNLIVQLSPLIPLEVLHIVLAAAREEVTQRAYLCTRLRELNCSPMLTVTIAAAFFTVPHIYQGIGALLPIFLMGVVFATAFLRSRQIWPLILAHASYNLVLYGQYLYLVRR